MYKGKNELSCCRGKSKDFQILSIIDYFWGVLFPLKIPSNKIRTIEEFSNFLSSFPPLIILLSSHTLILYSFYYFALAIILKRKIFWIKSQLNFDT